MLAAYYEHNVDAQKRVTMPSQYRKGFEKAICIIPSPDKDSVCLYVYDEDEWNRVCAGLQAKAVNAAVRRYQRMLNKSVTFADLDKAGRVTLTQELMDYAGITDKVVIMKNTSHIEIWSQENWDKECAAMDAIDAADIPEIIF